MRATRGSVMRAQLQACTGETHALQRIEERFSRYELHAQCGNSLTLSRSRDPVTCNCRACTTWLITPTDLCHLLLLLLEILTKVLCKYVSNTRRRRQNFQLNKELKNRYLRVYLRHLQKFKKYLFICGEIYFWEYAIHSNFQKIMVQELV
jgi:hypothetical protein